MRTHLAIAGFAAVGKTEVCRLLEQRLGFFRVSFGSVIEMIAVQRGLARDRQGLVTLGKRLVQEMGWCDFMGLLMKNTPTDQQLLFDGIRDWAAVDALRAAFGEQSVPLAFLDAPPAIRRDRMLSRKRDVDQTIDVDRFQREELEQTELELIRSRAELVVDASGDIEDTVAKLQNFLTVA